MSTNIRVSFEDSDRAELALGALRRAGIAFRASEPEARAGSGAPVSPEYRANLFFPHSVTLAGDRDQSLTASFLGSRGVVEFAEAPFPVRSSVRLDIAVADEKAGDALRILRNRGGYDALTARP